jgi:hypothetical protein
MMNAKEKVKTLLAYQALSDDFKDVVEENPDAFMAFLNSLGENPEASGATPQLNKFYAFRENFKPEMMPQMKIHQGEVAKELKLAVEFMQWLQAGLQNGSVAANQPNSMVHVLTGGSVFIILAPYLGERDLFHVFCKQRKDAANWGGAAAIKELSKLGYVSGEQKLSFVDEAGKKKETVNGLVLTPIASKSLLGKLSLAPSNSVVLAEKQPQSTLKTLVESVKV